MVLTFLLAWDVNCTATDGVGHLTQILGQYLPQEGHGAPITIPQQPAPSVRVSTSTWNAQRGSFRFDEATAAQLGLS